MLEIVSLLLTTLMFIILDAFWFSFSLDTVYKPVFQSVQGSPMELRPLGGLAAWFLLALGISYFVSGGDPDTAFIRGAIFGFCVYGVYNGTNYATLKNYDVGTAVIDTLWGTLAAGIVSVLSARLL